MKGIGRTMSEIRPVDANALVKQLSFDLEHDYDIYSSWYQKCERDAKYEFCIEQISEAPTIKPGDLRPHERYRIDGHHIRFKCCNKVLSIVPNESDDYENLASCPFCDAKMDGKDGTDND